MTGIASIFAGSLIFGVPVAFAVGIAAIAWILISGQVPINVVPTVIFGGMDSFPLLAIPFFVMVGDLATRCAILNHLIDLARVVIGPVRGGLAYVNVASSMLFGGVTGVAVADTAAVGGTLMPVMIRDGYPRGFSAAITAASSVMGAIIPPSVAMLIIVYVYGGGLSIIRLFLFGAVPGLLIGFVMMGYVWLIARRRGLPLGPPRPKLPEMTRILRLSLPGLGLPVIIIGGILGGVFTPTEAGAMGVLYCLLLGLLLYRNLTFRGLVESLLVSAKTSAMVYLLIGTAKLVAWLLTINLIPQTLAAALEPLLSSKEMFLLAVMVLFLVAGVVIEGIAAMIMFVPVIAPMAPHFGVDGHQLALVIVMTVQVALVTPPVAIGLFIVSRLADCPISQVAVEVLPFIGAILLVILLVIFFPQSASWLPELMVK